MSNQVKKIEKEMKKTENVKKYELYGSVLGSAIATIGKLSGKTEKEIISEFDKLKNDDLFSQSKNVLEACNFLLKYFDTDEKYKNNIILVYDDKNRFTPMVTLEVDNQILGLDPKGTPFGVLAHLDDDDVFYEYIYKEEEDEDNSKKEM